MTRSKLLQQTKVITDGKTAFNRKGFYSAKVIVIGGTNEADVKLQSGTSSEQTDLFTLGKSTGSGTVVSFDVDLSACGEYVKITGTSLTNVIVVLGDGDENPADSNKVIL